MNIKIFHLNDNYLEAYNAYLLSNKETILFASNKYRCFLKEFLSAEDHYFIAVNEKDEICGALPSFLKKNVSLGSVLNSLPFYGSNGGILEFSGNQNIRKMLIEEFYKFAEENNCVSSTIITSPFEAVENLTLYQSRVSSFVDQRMGQITTLPSREDTSPEKLMELFHYKTRNMIRKAQKNDIQVEVETSAKSFEFLFEVHQENMKKIGGSAKPKYFFELIEKFFEKNVDYKIYVARLNNKPVAALLLFYFNNTVEYFTPVISEEFRDLQPLSLLIFNAMQDAIRQGYERWNWGGTWISQTGVYNFKKRWGTLDYPYYYYVSFKEELLRQCTQKQLLDEYPYFYVCPFERIQK